MRGTLANSPRPCFRPEVRLLLACALTALGDPVAARIRELVQCDLDWRWLLSTALPHGMAPLLHRNLSAAGFGTMPATCIAELKERCLANLQRNLFFAARLLAVLSALEREGVEAVPYKGPLLAAEAYGSVSLREFCDLDILVRERDVSKAKALLVSMGYRPAYQLNQAQERAYLRSQCEYELLDRDGSTRLDLHWRVVPRHLSMPLDHDLLWRRVAGVVFLGKEVLGLSAEDSLIVLCVHGYKHRWERLEWVSGVAELLRAHEDLDCARLLALANAIRCRWILSLGLLLAEDLLEAPLPDAIRTSIHSDRAARSLASRLARDLFAARRGQTGALPLILFHMRARESFKDKVRIAYHSLASTNVRDWQCVPLPAWLFPLYSILRPFRLLKDKAMSCLKRLPRKRNATASPPRA